MSNRPQQRYEFGPFQLDIAERCLLREGRPVPMTPKVFDLLEVLVRNSGHLVEKDELIKQVWPDSFVEEGNLNRNVSILRKVLGDDSGRSYIRRCRSVAIVLPLLCERSRPMVLGSSILNPAQRMRRPKNRTRCKPLHEEFFQPAGGKFWPDWSCSPLRS